MEKIPIDVPTDIKMDMLVENLGSEDTWIDHAVVKKSPSLRNKIASRFRPKRPSRWAKNPRQWLDTYDIERVMSQYKASHRDFDFLGVYASDFEVIGSNRRAMYRSHVDKRYDRFGAIFNMDRHDQPGSHWVACYISLNPARKMFGVYYYDSLAKPPLPPIVKWIVYVSKEFQKYMIQVTDREFVLTYNRIRRQYENTECGMYSMVFLNAAINTDETFEGICDAMGNDDDMNEARKLLFR
jgi:hypothetical protein